MGFVDKSFMTDGEEGFRLAKVRIREERFPAIGDKFCSRCGQKGTIGLIMEEDDMPFTANGQRPDIIINPHALPSRMTIGQLLETLVGKACSLYGSFGDCTAFVNEGPKHEVFGKLLTNNGYHSTGNEIMYNGMTGEQIEAEIYMGPTYYMRLKHMVKDKVNYRAQGPRTTLTRQPVQGRANDGGLRIGEMERDGIIAHGATSFLQESMLVRGDTFYMAVCNKTGMVSIYNETNNIFLSPMADGPIQFTETLDNKLKIENISRFGRDFSIVKVPYALKLLMQELTTMNVQLRLITEDNINQLENMSFSKNINKLLSKKDTSVEKAIPLQNTVAVMNQDAVNKALKDKQPEIVRKLPDGEESQNEFLNSNMLDLMNDEPSSKTVVTYDFGNEVRYKADTNQDRKWFISKVMDNGRYVITTYNLINLPKIDGYTNNQQIAMVTVSGVELYKISEPEKVTMMVEDDKKLNIGDSVYYTKDTLQHRLWKIIDIDSKNNWMVTVRSYNLNDIPNKMRPFIQENKYITIEVPTSELLKPGTPQYDVYSPGSSPPGSPQYNPNTPPDSPQYAPGSPHSPPGSPHYSPQYAPGSPQYPPQQGQTIIINTGNSAEQAQLKEVKRKPSDIYNAVSNANEIETEDISSLDPTAPKEETLNVTKIVDNGNGNKQISILTDVAQEKKEIEKKEDESSKKTIKFDSK